MRRLSAISLLLLTLLPVLAPLAALGSDDEDMSVPVCCRRHGGKQHHCAMMMAFLASKLPGHHLQAVPTPCPDCPGTLPASTHIHWTNCAAALFYADVASHPALFLQTEARARIALDRAWRKRGPPSVVLL